MQELLISKIRTHYVLDKIDFDDFNDLKKEYKEMLNFLNEQLALVNERLISCYTNNDVGKLKGRGSNVFALLHIIL